MNYLSVAKVRQHGHSDRRWKVGDKITQYKGAINLLLRDKNVLGEQEGDQLRRQTKELKMLQQSLRSKKEQLEHLFNRDRELVEALLINHKALRLTCRNMRPDEITEAGVQRVYTMRRKLDLIAYRLKKKEEELTSLLLEVGDIRHSIMFAVEKRIPTEVECKRITGKVQEMSLLKEAAISVYNTYVAIRDTLCKDRVYYEHLLESLVQNHLEQNRLMLRVTILGQVACEKVDDKRTECADVSRLLNKIAQFEKRKNSTRAFVAEMDANLKRLVRKEGSDTTKFVDLVHQEKVDALNDDIESVRVQLEFLQESIMVTKYEDLVTTMVSQSSMRKRILLLKEHMLEMRQKLQARIKRLSAQLNRVRCTASQSDLEYTKREGELRRNIEELKKRSKDVAKRKEVKCELLAQITQRLLHLKGCTKHLCVSSTALVTRGAANLLNVLQPKIHYLRDRDEETNVDVEMYELYSRYIAKKKVIVQDRSGMSIDRDPTDDEIKMDDVPSRKTIKLRSVQLVETAKELEL